MSMFHELMMRKKEQIMYATIKGSLTESPEGVFSGFTPTNYLSLDCGTNTINQWEISIDFDYTVAPSSYKGLFSRYSPAFQIYMTSTKKLFVEINGSDDLADFGVLTLNSDYNIKVKYNAGSWDMVLTNKTTGTIITKTTTTSDIWYLSGIFRFGITQSGNYGWDNTINLNTSYLKIGSTKYKLQAVVGYTVVGSPTITDGVVSGFSNSDYVLLNENIPFATGDVFIEMKYSVTSLSGTTLLGTYGSSRMQLKYSSNKLEFYWAGNQIINFSGFNLTNYQYIRVVSNYLGGTLEIYASVDGNNWSLITSANNVNWNYSQTYPTQFGRYPVSSDFAIDFNNTYIKLDGKLWFNGQSAQ